MTTPATREELVTVIQDAWNNMQAVMRGDEVDLQPLPLEDVLAREEEGTLPPTTIQGKAAYAADEAKNRLIDLHSTLVDWGRSTNDPSLHHLRDLLRHGAHIVSDVVERVKKAKLREDEYDASTAALDD